jgi:hypothetical protein
MVGWLSPSTRPAARIELSRAMARNTRTSLHSIAPRPGQRRKRMTNRVAAERPRICRLLAGGNRIRTFGPGAMNAACELPKRSAVIRSLVEFVDFASRDENAWTQVGTANIQTPGTILAGMAITAHTDRPKPSDRTNPLLEDLCVAVIDKVTLEAPPGPV